MILDGAMLGQRMFGEPTDPRDLLVRLYPQVDPPPLGHVVATAPPLVARVNHGIWIASCPCGAKGIPTPGGVVFFETPLVFCLRCQNAATGRGWRPVAVPDEEERRRVEAVLLLRPRVEDRNWEPGETIADLVAQNLDHGDPVPDPSEPLGPELGPDWRQTVAPFGQAARRELGSRWWQRLLPGRR